MRSQVHERVFFSWGGGGGGGGGWSGYSQLNDALSTPIARRIVFLSTLLPIDDYQGVTCMLTKFIPGVDTVE